MNSLILGMSLFTGCETSTGIIREEYLKDGCLVKIFPQDKWVATVIDAIALAGVDDEDRSIFNYLTEDYYYTNLRERLWKYLNKENVTYKRKLFLISDGRSGIDLEPWHRANLAEFVNDTVKLVKKLVHIQLSKI